MAKKHKHEEHVNHERWLVSFADMMTLLFALFVVLYAMSVVDLDKANMIKKSIRFYFHIEGDGATQTEGNFTDGQGSDLPDGVDLVSAQQGSMVEFLKDYLDQQEKSGTSSDIVQNDDSIAVKLPLSDIFVPGKVKTFKPGAYELISTVCTKSMEYASEIRVIFEYDYAPFRVLDGGKTIFSDDVIASRQVYVKNLLLQMPRIEPNAVITEMREWPESRKRLGNGWEERARLTLVFSTNSGG